MTQAVNNRTISGKDAAENIVERVKARTAELAGAGIKPGLAVIIVGSDPASQVYVSAKGKKAEECGFFSFKQQLPPEVAEDRLLALIEALNRDPAIHGILVQSIAPEKNVDGFHFINVGKLGTGETRTAFVPCTPAGSMILIERIHGKDLSGLSAVVVGRSNIVGKPMANLLLAANATVTIAHSRTSNLDAVCRQADIIVAAVGRPRMIRGDWIKQGATVIDVGINRVPLEGGEPGKTRLVGDVDFGEAAARAGAITPVPGGVGPMTIAMLMANTLRAACLAHDASAPF